MLMKKIFILLMVGSLLFSCQITDVLNQEPPHNLTPDNAITEKVGRNRFDRYLW